MKDVLEWDTHIEIKNPIDIAKDTGHNHGSPVIFDHAAQGSTTQQSTRWRQVQRDPTTAAHF